MRHPVWAYSLFGIILYRVLSGFLGKSETSVNKRCKDSANQNAQDEPEQIWKWEAHKGFRDAINIQEDGIAQNKQNAQNNTNSQRCNSFLHDDSSLCYVCATFWSLVKEHVLQHTLIIPQNDEKINLRSFLEDLEELHNRNFRTIYKKIMNK